MEENKETKDTEEIVEPEDRFSDGFESDSDSEEDEDKDEDKDEDEDESMEELFLENPLKAIWLRLESIESEIEDLKELFEEEDSEES